MIVIGFLSFSQTQGGPGFSCLFLPMHVAAAVVSAGSNPLFCSPSGPVRLCPEWPFVAGGCLWLLALTVAAPDDGARPPAPPPAGPAPPAADSGLNNLAHQVAQQLWQQLWFLHRQGGPLAGPPGPVAGTGSGPGATTGPATPMTPGPGGGPGTAAAAALPGSVSTAPSHSWNTTAWMPPSPAAVTPVVDLVGPGPFCACRAFWWCWRNAANSSCCR